MSKEQSEQCNSVIKCFLGCFRLLFKKISKTLERTEVWLINFFLKIIFGFSISLIISFLILSNLHTTTIGATDVILNANCGILVSPVYSNSDFLDKSVSQTYFEWDRDCFNISLGDIDENYREYTFHVSQLYFTSKMFWQGENSIEKREVAYYYGKILIPHVEQNEITHQEQRFIIFPNRPIEITGRDGSVFLGEFLKYDNEYRLRVYFKHNISWWVWLLKNTRITS